MKLPYGVADFYSLRSRGQLYIDRTDRIATVEELGTALLFLRPRRFGKSLWLSTLAAYYDLARKNESTELFGDLAIGKDPTPLAHQYFVMRWDFSEIDSDPPPRGVNAGVSSRHQRLANEIHGYLNTAIETFLIDYQAHLPPLQLGEDAFHNLDRLLANIRQTPFRLYLLIDEYDNFASEVLTADGDAYTDLVQSDGPFKYLFKWVKAAVGRKGIDRLFITGVSPMVMADVTSGMNIARNVSLKPALADLCGFTENEVDQLLSAVLAERGNTEVNAADARLMLREWYNGYRFALGVPERVYNPTLVFHFLLHLLEEGTFPRQMLDSNLTADEGKLHHLAQVASTTEEGPGTLIDLIRKGEPLKIRQLLDRFTLTEPFQLSAQDSSCIGSYLYYLGLLTPRPEESIDRGIELVVPNELVRGLFLNGREDDGFARMYTPGKEPRSERAANLQA